MKVEIWSDVICPFCYIGKRNFETALEQFAERKNIEVIWKSFQLDASIPEVATESYAEYLVKRKGMAAEQVQGMLTNVTEMASQVGLDYHLDQSVIVNSQKAHQLIQFAKSKELGNEAEERLFSAFFTESKNIADTETLVRLGKDFGLEESELKASLEDEKYKYEITQDIQEAQNIGVTGVPFFVFDRKYAVSGAQPAEVFLQSLNKSFSEWRTSNPGATLAVTQANSCNIDGSCG
ncbi:DsbA family oxidoreductase [Sphingobacterium pedocola]|uniref:Disulfide bond formation protein DsbA n=1 Tax=Sphingobacterium pedocola TaxID=2082722 RepID=A0ABR9TA37_9SPHI|nr:DsbA family oxidoreductase [Sphingobacterium pedocola]MBE8721887.1 disulfide bond formation protein DsbA [Sphingobacterium pedocola]